MPKKGRGKKDEHGKESGRRRGGVGKVRKRRVMAKGATKRAKRKSPTENNLTKLLEPKTMTQQVTVAPDNSLYLQSNESTLH